MPNPLTDRRLDLPGIRHGFFTREGGVSAGIYKSLNCGVGSDDDRALVLENRARVTRAIGIDPQNLATPYQVHGTEALVVSEVWEAGRGPRADAVVTRVPGIAVGVGSADCGPTLFADPKARIVAASHSGWRGARSGVLESTIATMERLGARRERIVAILGPMISQPNYEVGPDLIAQFIDAAPDNERYFKPSGRRDHALFDLPAYIVARLTNAGVTAAALDLCTYADETRFFSYRRATHRGEPDYGRHLSVIAIEG